MIIVRTEMPEDYSTIYQVNKLAFGRFDEAELVNQLRNKVQPLISLVGILDDKIVGHILFSPVTIESTESSAIAIALGPMAVLPEYQKKGIGSRLIRQGFLECQKIGHNVVFVLGYPSYYPRFGFVPSRPQGISCEYRVPDDVFMVVELFPGALQERKGIVKYHAIFNSVE